MSKTVTDFKAICNNESTGRINAKKVIDIESILRDLPKYKDIFLENPNNNTIKDSIRRNLQELMDLGLIKFLGKGKYKKLWN